jgi:hypothetical protein
LSSAFIGVSMLIAMVMVMAMPAINWRTSPPERLPLPSQFPKPSG